MNAVNAGNNGENHLMIRNSSGSLNESHELRTGLLITAPVAGLEGGEWRQ